MLARSVTRRSLAGVRTFVSRSQRRAGGGGHAVEAGHGDHHHGPLMPPFSRNPPPRRRLHEETELVWDDSVAPETCIDFDAPHISSRQAISMWLGGFTFFASLIGVISLTDPVGSNPAAPRRTVLPPGMAKFDLSGVEAAEEEE